MSLSDRNNDISDKKFILSIETAVEGGSLSILANQVEVDGWIGAQQISKAEDVLEQISTLLKDNKISKEQINLIAISKGAGSLTGEKIGLALAKGLSKSLKCRLVEVSVFESLLLELTNRSEGNYFTAIPLGKDKIQWQSYSTANNGKVHFGNTIPQISTIDEFFKILKNSDGKNTILAQGFLKYFNIFDLKFENTRFTISSNSLAKLNGLTI